MSDRQRKSGEWRPMVGSFVLVKMRVQGNHFNERAVCLEGAECQPLANVFPNQPLKRGKAS